MGTLWSSGSESVSVLSPNCEIALSSSFSFMGLFSKYLRNNAKVTRYIAGVSRKFAKVSRLFVNVTPLFATNISLHTKISIFDQIYFRAYDYFIVDSKIENL